MSRRRDQTQAGSAAVEAAIGVPVFLLLVSLAFLGGRLAITHQAVQSAASEGARLASLARTAPEARAAEPAFVDRLLSCCSDTLSLMAAPATLDRLYDLGPEAFDPVLDILRASVPNIVLDVPHDWTD